MKNEIGLHLTGKRVLMRVPKIERMSKGGIALPDRTFEKENAAQLTAIFVDAGFEATEDIHLKGIQRGDVILFARYAGAGFEFEIQGTTYRVCNAGDVVGKWEQGAPELDGHFRAAESFMQVYGETMSKAA